MKKVLYWFSVIWIIAAFGLSIYELIYEVGLYSKLLNFALNTFGSASLKLTMLLTVIIYALPGFIVLNLTRPPKKQEAKNLVIQARNTAFVMFALGAFLLIAGFGAYLFGKIYSAQATNTTPQMPNIVSFDLNKTAEPPALSGADGYDVSGVLRRDKEYTIEKSMSGTKTITVFCPIVSSAWKPSDPVKFFVKADPAKPVALADMPFENSLKGYKQVDFGNDSPLTATIEGTIAENSLPDYARNAITKQGVKISDKYYVLSAEPFYNQPKRSGLDEFARTSWMAIIIGAILSFIFFAAGLAALFRWRKLLNAETRL